MDRISIKRIEKYLNTTERALKNITIAEKRDIEWEKKAKEFLDMADRYYRDAMFYKKKGDYVTAFASVNYAHGWIDAGVRLGLFDAPNNTSDIIMPRE